MTKIPFEILSLEVEKLYQKSFSIPPEDVVEINKSCELIADFIRSCGWTEEQYISRMFGFDNGN